MSDPVTKVEDVEDVLSSIRRLVSATPQQREAESEADGMDTAPAESDRKPQEALVLTSSLRINEPKVTEASVEPATKPTDLESLRRAVSGEFDADMVEEIVEVEASDVDEAAEVPTSWVKSTPEDYYEDEPDEATEELSDLHAEAAWVEDAAEEVEEAAEEIEAAVEDEIAQAIDKEDSTDEEVEASDDADADEASVEEYIEDSEVPEHEEYEQAETAEIHQFDATHAEDNEDTDMSVEGDIKIEDAASEYEAAEDETAEEGSLEYEPESSVENDEPPQDEAAIETDDQPVEVDTHDDVETVGIASFLRSSGASVEADPVKVEPHEELSATMFAADDDEEVPAVELGDMDEAVIDEDMLRDLVAEIVRQELTGVMGERITRNVRKLVRREIHRALVSREFE